MHGSYSPSKPIIYSVGLGAGGGERKNQKVGKGKKSIGGLIEGKKVRRRKERRNKKVGKRKE